MAKKWIIFLSFLFITVIAWGNAYSGSGSDVILSPSSTETAPLFPAPPVTLYTYQSGAWDNIDVWTTDPGGTTLVGSKIPENGDAVVILPSRTLTLRNGNVITMNLDITIQEGGILDDSIYTFTQTLSSLNGKGTLKIKSTGFPAAASNTLVTPGGGTVEFYYDAADYSLPSQTTYNNLIINSPGRKAIQTGNITLNGDLTVKNGTYQINDNAPTRRTLIIFGDATINTGASLTVGTGNTTSTADPTATGTGGTAPYLNYYVAQSHRIEIYGDFTNNGTARFTNQAFPVFNAFPNDGIATVFFRGNSDNTLTCNGTTDFYSLVEDKGSDQTFILTVNSSGYDKFRIFGANNAGEFAGADANNPNIRKALWIRTGTLKLNGFVFIPSLVEGSASGSGDFYIPANGAMVIDGPDVVVMGTIDDYRVVNLAYGVPGGTGAVNGVTTDPSVFPSAFSLYGKLQVNDGNLYIGEIGRIVYFGTSTAEFIINGGTIDTKQFQSVSGGGKTAYRQTGGNLILRGRFKRTLLYTSLSDMITSIGNVAQLNTSGTTVGTDPNVGTLNIDQDANVFNMEGGSISIYDVSGSTGTPRAVEINSDPSNINVTGGNISVYMTLGTLANVDYGIVSKAPLYNLNITRNSGVQSSILLAIPAKVGVTAVANPTLNILNNLILSDLTGSANAVLNSGNFDVSAGGNFTIQANAEYYPGTNRTILNGTGAQTIINSGTILSGGLNKFIINKSSGTATLGSNLIIRDSLAIFSGTLNDGGYTLLVAGNIYNAGIHTGTGKIVLGAGSGTQMLTASVSGSPSLGNLEINSTTTNAVAAQLGSDFSVGSLTMTSNKILDIGSYQFTVNAGGLATGTFSITRMIRTSGFSSDKGLRMLINASALTSGNIKLFPLGVSGKYTPATINGNTIPGTGTGYVTFVPVNAVHPAANAGKKQLLFYWKSKSEGMPAGSNVYYSFSDNEASDWDAGINSAYVLLSGATTWESGGSAANPNVNINGVPNSNGYISAEITAGNNSAFNNIQAYYSIGDGLWNSNIWSTASHTGASCNCQPDKASDIVYIGGRAGQNDSITLPAGTYSLASLTINGSYTADQRRPVLNIQGNGGSLTVDIITGGGKLSSSSNVITAGASDLGGLTGNDSALIHFYGNAYTLPAGITSYPNLLITGGNTKILPAANIVIRRNLKILDNINANNALSLNGASGNLTVYGDVEFQNGGKLLIPASLTAGNISIYGNINFRYGNTNNANAIEAISGAGTTHQLNFYGSNIISGASSLLFNPAAVTNKIDLYIKNAGTTTITEGTGNFRLNRLFIQKNVSADIVYFRNNFVLNESANNTAAKSLNLITGTLIISDPANSALSTVNLNLSSGGTSSFSIPASAALVIRNGAKLNITGLTSGSGIRLDGLLQAENGSQINLADGGAANTGYIEYSGSGNSEINLYDASVLKVAQVRRSLSLTTGILKYTQSGSSAVTVYGTGTAGIVDATRAKFEITGTGTSFNMSGTATLSIISGGGTTFGDLYLRPEISSVTGGEIIFGSGVIGQSYKIDASVPINNLSLFTTGVANNLQIMVNPLVINGTLALNNANSTLTSNNINVTINGNFINNGIYNAGSNTTIFSGSSQSISGINDPQFWNLTVSPANKLSLSRDITVNNVLNITNGMLECAIRNVTLKGNIINNGAITNTTSGSLLLSGTSLQHISGAGSFGRMELDNNLGARLDNDITLTEDLTLTNGILDINQYLLALGQNSDLTSPGFGITRMIKLDGVLSNMGIQKDFGSTFTGTFFFPTGVTGKYTPATLTVNSTAAGYVRIKVIDERHPATLSPFNVLNYYWETASSIPVYDGSLIFQYSASDVSGNESQYVAARLIIPPGTGWSKAAPGAATDNVDEAAHTISFDFPAGTANLGGQYTAGYDSDLSGTIQVYTSNVASGNWDTPASWMPLAPAGGPNGFVVIINPGNTIYTNGNKRFAYKTTINGTLNVGTTYGHNLGTVDGTGTLSMQQANLPAGDFSSFISCSGGTLEYGGNTSYTIVADRIFSVRNLYFTGTGTRTLPDKDLVICNQLLINGPVLNNSFNRRLSIGGSFDLTAGSFLSGTGAGATVSFIGSAAQTISGFNTLNPLNNLEINNSAGLTFGSAIDIAGNLLLTRGIISTTATNILRMTNQASDAIPAGGSSSSYVNGPMTKSQFGGTDFIFPVGKSSRYGKLALLNPKTGIWESEYYNIGFPYLTVTGTLSQASSTEYWRITSPANGKTTKVQLRWDSQSDVTPITTLGGITDIRVAEYNGTDWVEKASDVPLGNNTDGTVQTSASIPVNNTGNPQYYTLGSSSRVKPTITLGIPPDMCSGSLTALLPYTSVTGSPDQYMIDFDAAANAAGFIDVSWTALFLSPITIAKPAGIATGTYHGVITVRTSIPVNQGIGYPFVLAVTTNMTWTGAISTDWNTPGNWSCGVIPGLINNVLIPDIAREPILNTGSAGAVNNLTIASGSSLSVTGNTLQIAGIISNSGVFTASAGSIEMRGSVVQSIPANVFAGNSIKDLTINNPAGVDLLGTLSVTGIVTAQNGNLASGGFLTLASTVAGTALINGVGAGSVTGNLTMQRYLSSGFGYKYFSSPFQAATVNEFTEEMDLMAAFPTFYKYDESRTTAGWIVYTDPAGLLLPLNGYAVNFGPLAASKTVNVTGAVNNGNSSIPLFNHNNTYTQGFNLVGNPYPSPVDWNAAGWTKTNIDDALYYFKAGGADQYSGTYSTYINGVSNDGMLFKNIIPSMQGFFVHVTTTFPSGVLATSNSVRVTDMTHSFLKSDGSNPAPLFRLRVWFADDTVSGDPVVIYFDEKATPGFDSRQDALKLMNTDPLTPNLYAVLPDDINLSINALSWPEDYLRVIPLGLKLARGGTIVFRITDMNNFMPESQVYLHDKITGFDQRLDLSGKYKVLLSEGEYNGRFFLKFFKNANDISETGPGINLFSAYSSHGILYTDINYLSGNAGTLMVYNISGTKVFTREVFSTGSMEFNPSLGTGMYMVTLKTGKFIETEKIFIY